MNQRYWSSRIQGLVPYTPGEQPKDRTFIKLNTNENPYPPSPRVLEAIRREADQRLRLYPDPESAALRGALAEHYGVEPEQVFCGNGSDEVLGLCFYALFSPGRKVVFPDITYSFYPVYTELFGLDYEEIPLNEDFTLPVERFLRGNGGAVICNPNAPTGRALPLSDIRRIVEANPAAAVLVTRPTPTSGPSPLWSSSTSIPTCWWSAPCPSPGPWRGCGSATPWAART